MYVPGKLNRRDSILLSLYLSVVMFTYEYIKLFLFWVKLQREKTGNTPFLLKFQCRFLLHPLYCYAPWIQRKHLSVLWLTLGSLSSVLSQERASRTRGSANIHREQFPFSSSLSRAHSYSPEFLKTADGWFGVLFPLLCLLTCSGSGFLVSACAIKNTQGL